MLRRIANARFSLQGLVTVFREETNIRLFTLWGGVSIFLFFLADTADWQRALVIASLVLMLSLELMNSAVERLANVVQPDHDLRIQAVKDISSASVFISGCLFAALWIIFMAQSLF